jgi:hypothetical protein
MRDPPPGYTRAAWHIELSEAEDAGFVLGWKKGVVGLGGDRCGEVIHGGDGR